MNQSPPNLPVEIAELAITEAVREVLISGSQVLIQDFDFDDLQSARWIELTTARANTAMTELAESVRRFNVQVKELTAND